MKEQKILEEFQKQIKIENYSNQTIKSYLSALKFLETTRIYTRVSSCSINKIKSPVDGLKIYTNKKRNKIKLTETTGNISFGLFYAGISKYFICFIKFY